MPKPSKQKGSTQDIEQFIQDCQSTEHFSGRSLSICSKISRGTVNQCWKLKSGDKFYLARLSQKLPDQFLTHWHAEIDLNHAAATADISVAPLWIDSTSLAAIYPWCGEPLKKNNLSPVILQELGGKLSALHGTKSPAQKISYRQTIESYIGLIEGSRVSTTESIGASLELLQLADQWDTTSELGFCHHDLNPGNILWDGQGCTLIDWEYARLAHPLFDLSSLSYHFDLSNQQLEILLQSYSRKTYSSDQVRAAEVMVVGLERLWTRAANLTICSP